MSEDIFESNLFISPMTKLTIANQVYDPHQSFVNCEIVKLVIKYLSQQGHGRQVLIRTGKDTAMLL